MRTLAGLEHQLLYQSHSNLVVEFLQALVLVRKITRLTISTIGAWFRSFGRKYRGLVMAINFISNHITYFGNVIPMLIQFMSKENCIPLLPSSAPTRNYRTHLGSLDVISSVWSPLLCSGLMPRNSPHLAMLKYGLFTLFLAMIQSITGVSHRATYVNMSRTSRMSVGF